MYNLPMAQFEVFHGMGVRVITIRDITRYDAFYGFRRVIATIKD